MLQKVFLGVLLLGVFLCLLAPQARAHNEQEETTLTVEVDGKELVLSYRTKFPKSGSFTRLKQMDRSGDGSYSAEEKTNFLTARAEPYQDKVSLKMGQIPLQLTQVEQRAEVEKGMMGLEELVVSYTFETVLPEEPGPDTSLTLHDPVFGWNEVTLQGTSGKVSGDIPGDDVKIQFGETHNPGAHGDHHGEGGAHSEDELMGLVSGELTPSVLAWTLGLAFVLGAIHALTPGHGKTMVAAYLVGSRGTVSQAVLLGIVVTVTHTATVFLLGLACLFAFQYVVPEKIIPWLGFLSGLLITGVGIALIWARSTGKELFHGHSHENGHGHCHSHSHDQGHDHNDTSPGEDGPKAREADELGDGHSHHSHAHHQSEQESSPVHRRPEQGEDKLSLWALISLGVSGGMVPCPEALMVLLGAISLNRLLLGLAVLVSFSAGLASLLIVIGVLVVTASNRVSKKYYPSDETVKKVSITAYSFICVMGLVIAVRSLTAAGILVLNL